MGNLRCRPDERGTALPTIIVLMVVLGFMTVAALQTTSDDRMAAHNVRESTRAFYAAEAGANLVVAQWDSLQYDTLMAAPGDSFDLGWRTLPENGASYRAVVQRVDNGSTPIYNLKVTGRTAGSWGGQSLVSLALTTLAGSINVPGAITITGGGLNVGSGGGVVVDGNDNVAPGWAPACDPPGGPMPGITTPDSSFVTTSGAPLIAGSPAINEDPSFTSADFNTLWDQLVPLANKVYTSQTTIINGTAPVENPPGTCDTSVMSNWGAPTDPTHPCFDYFPIIHMKNGRIKTANGSSGQGILLVDFNGAGKGDLEMENGYTFYGLILVKGEFELETGAAGTAPARVYGGVMVDNKGGIGNSKIWTDSDMLYSSCVIKRVSENTGLGVGGITRLAGSWTALSR